MKLIKRIVFMACALAAMLLTSCADSSDSNDTGAGGGKEPASETAVFEEGWWKFTTTVENISTSYYFYFNENKRIERGGNEKEEWKSDFLDTQIKKSEFSWESISKQNNDGYHTLKKEAPEWSIIPELDSLALDLNIDSIPEYTPCSTPYIDEVRSLLPLYSYFKTADIVHKTSDNLKVIAKKGKYTILQGVSKGEGELTLKSGDGTRDSDCLLIVII